MKVRDIMTPNVAFVTEQTTIQETAQMMKKLDVGSVPVCNQDSLVGIVTDRDILIRGVAENIQPQVSSVGSIMSQKVQTITPETNIHDAAKIMASQQIRRLPVVENDAIVGMVALSDIAVNTDFKTEIASSLTEISNPIH